MTAGYPRLRLGIGESVDTTAVDHVLAPFSTEEREVLVPSLDRATQACLAWLAGAEIPSLMATFNGGAETTNPDPPIGNQEP